MNSPQATQLHNNPSADFAHKLEQTVALLIKASKDFAPCTQASSLGAEDMVITHLIHQHRLAIPVFVLDTGALHTQTLALLERVQAAATALSPVHVYKPELEQVLHFIRRSGQDSIYRSQALRKECCGIRKLEPLARALRGQKAWITGLRAEQSQNRAQMQSIEPPVTASQTVPAEHSEPLESANPSPTKINPLMNWTWGDVWHYLHESGADYNPLHDQFYPSIGCAPCTRAISLGEDFRAGRWWWEAQNSAKECGLHPG